MINKNGFFVTSRITYFGKEPRKERNTLIAWLTFDKIVYTTYCISRLSPNYCRPTLGLLVKFILWIVLSNYYSL